MPLIQGENTIAVTATDTDGQMYTVEITVHAEINGQRCHVVALPETGIAPYTGALKIEAPTSLTRSTVLDFGPASVKIGLGPLELTPVSINQSGLYRFEVEAKSIDGQIFNDEVAILVCDAEQIDALLRAKWNAMKTCLAGGNIQGALNYINSANKAEFEETFTSLGDQLQLMVQQMQDIELVHAEAGFAKYQIIKDEMVGEETYSIIYDIYFGTDENGVWKIDRF